jgi:hypothetical protein
MDARRAVDPAVVVEGGADLHGQNRSLLVRSTFQLINTAAAGLGAKAPG